MDVDGAGKSLEIKSLDPAVKRRLLMHEPSTLHATRCLLQSGILQQAYWQYEFSIHC